MDLCEGKPALVDKVLPTISLSDSVERKALFSNCESRLKSVTNIFLNRFLHGKWRQRLFKNVKLTSGDSVSWLLGRPYVFKSDDNINAFLADFRQKIWFSYREKYSPLLNATSRNDSTSDCGWGCTIRCAQMMLAQAIVLQILGRETIKENNQLHKIIRLFEDCELAPLSIHCLLRIAVERHRKLKCFFPNSNIDIKDDTEITEISYCPIGKWFSPSEAIVLLQQAVKKSSPIPSDSLILALEIYVSIDNNLIVEEIVSLSENWKKAVFAVVSLRLGTTSINKIYYNQIKKLFTIEQCCGVIGGRPNKAFYFVGSVDERLYYLDPHTVQKYQPLTISHKSFGNVEKLIKLPKCSTNWDNTNKTCALKDVDVSSKGVSSSKSNNKEFYVKNKEEEEEEKKWESFHSLNTLSIPISEVDPSCSIGFLFCSQDDLHTCIRHLVQGNIIESPIFLKKHTCVECTQKTPLFTIIDKRPSPLPSSSGNIQFCSNYLGKEKSPSKSNLDEGFEFL